MAARIGLLAGLFLAASLVSGCAAHGPASDGLVRTGTSPATYDLVATAQIDKDTYKYGDRIKLVFTLTNRSTRTLYLYGDLGIGESASLSFDLKDPATGTEIPLGMTFDALPPPPRSKEDYVRLDPAYVYGVTLDLAMEDLGITHPGHYELIVTYHSPLTKDFTLGLPAWTREMGVLTTTPIIFKVGDLK